MFFAILFGALAIALVITGIYFMATKSSYDAKVERFFSNDGPIKWPASTEWKPGPPQPPLQLRMEGGNLYYAKGTYDKDPYKSILVIDPLKAML